LNLAYSWYVPGNRKGESTSIAGGGEKKYKSDMGVAEALKKRVGSTHTRTPVKETTQGGPSALKLRGFLRKDRRIGVKKRAEESELKKGCGGRECEPDPAG